MKSKLKRVLLCPRAQHLKSFLTALSSLVISIFSAPIASADISIIVNAANKVTLDSVQIKEIFLGKKRRFPSGAVIKTVDQPESSSARKDFYSKIANMDEIAMKVYWSTQIFTGNSIPPKTLGNDEEVENFVKNNVEAIGYIDSSKSVDSSINVISILK